jgi:hypothetical protein
VETSFSENGHAATAGRDNKQRNKKFCTLFVRARPTFTPNRQSESLRITDRFQIAVEWCRFATSPHEIAPVICSF